MASLTTTNSNLDSVYREAGLFLNLEQAARADSEWFKSFRDDVDVRSFFRKSILSKATSLQVTVVAQVAHAYVACVENGDVELGPTGSEVRELMKSATDLESKLDAARPSWLIPDAHAKDFREPLRKLRKMPSKVPPRTSGRLPLIQRRTFVLCLAQAICEIVDEFPVRFIAAATVRAWEETTERQIRDILTVGERDAIRLRVKAKRQSIADSENVAHLALSRASVAPNGTFVKPDTRTDGQRLAQMLDIAKGFSDETSAIVMYDAVANAASELRIEPDTPVE